MTQNAEEVKNGKNGNKAFLTKLQRNKNGQICIFAIMFEKIAT